MNFYAESSTQLQPLRASATGRDWNHKGFVNILTIKQNNLWAPDHFDVLFGHWSLYFPFFNKWKSIVHDNENNEQSTFTRSSRELFFLQLAYACGSDSQKNSNSTTKPAPSHSQIIALPCSRGTSLRNPPLYSTWYSFWNPGTHSAFSSSSCAPVHTTWNRKTDFHWITEYSGQF